MKPRIMYIECKEEGLNGRGRIGRVNYSKTGKTLYYDGKEFRSLKGGYKANYVEIETGEMYWISGSKRDGRDRLYGTGACEIDEDARVEYWEKIRLQPNKIKQTRT